MTLYELALKLAKAMPRDDRAGLAFELLEGESEEITFRRQGVRWTALPWDRIISMKLFIEGHFQGSEVWSVLVWMNSHGRFKAPREVIIDVGANIGTSTIPFALKTGCRVIAIEPAPEIIAVLRRNVADNGLAERVICVEAAIAGGDGSVTVVSPEVNGGASEVVRPGREPSFSGSLPVRGAVEVATTGLSDVLGAHGVAPEQVAFAWSDTQGCEIDVIESGQSLWAAGVPLYAEWDPRVWGGPREIEALFAAASQRFAAFIPASSLVVEGAAATPRPIASLADFSHGMGPEGDDLLLLPA